MDQFIDDLLMKDRVCATSLWKMPSRQQLEDLELLDERISPLGDEIDEIDADEDAKPREEAAGGESESGDMAAGASDGSNDTDDSLDNQMGDRNGPAHD
jgi:pre-mRNA-splicing factor 38A